MDLQRVFEQFSALLEVRFKAGSFTTEDSVRYTFYAAALQHGGLQPAEVVLECPHPSIQGAEVDTLVLPGVGRDAVAIEFKYDRCNPGGRNQNRTQRAAAVFVDIFRLARIPDSTAPRRYLVYLTDGEMARYFRNPANRLDTFFNAAPEAALAVTPAMYEHCAATFRNGVARYERSCAIRNLLSVDFTAGLFLRVFEVGAAEQGTLTSEAPSRM